MILFEAFKNLAKIFSSQGKYQIEDVNLLFPENLAGFSRKSCEPINTLDGKCFLLPDSVPENDRELQGQGVIATYSNNDSLACTILAFRPAKPSNFLGYYPKAFDIIAFVYPWTMQHSGKGRNNLAYGTGLQKNYSTFRLESEDKKTQYYLHNFCTGARKEDWFFSLKCPSQNTLDVLLQNYTQYLSQNFKTKS